MTEMTPEKLREAANAYFFGGLAPKRLAKAAMDAASAWEADRKDAARYRWLRDGNAYAPEEDGVIGGDDLDKLCDAALAEKEGT